MSGGTELTGQETQGARALREWILGEPDEYARVVLVEREATADDLDALVRPDDVLLLPAESASYSGQARTVRYTGALREIGDELFLGPRGVELQDYVAAAFVQIVGPTVVCVVDDVGRRAFVDDAQLARRTGVFPSALLDPRVVLADRAAIERPDEVVVPSSLRLGADGRVSVGVRGAAIGRVDDLRTSLAEPWRRDTAYRGADAQAIHALDPTAAAWIGRYLGATDLMKMLGLVNGAARISGFGWSPIDDGGADAEPRTADPFLLDTADGVVLADITTLRRQLLAPPTAVVVETTQTSSTLDVAARRIARGLGVSIAAGERLCREAREALDVHLGRRVGTASRMGSAA